MESSPRILRGAVVDLARNAGAVVVYDLLFRLASAALLAPATAWLLRSLLERSGRAALGNFDIAPFLLSPSGLAWIAAWSTIALFTSYLELGGLVLVGDEAAGGRRPSGWRAFARLLDRFPNLFRLGLRQFAGYAVVSIPGLAIIGVGYLVLWRGSDLYYLTTQRPPAFWMGVGVAGLAVALTSAMALWLSLRWLVALPAVMVEGLGPSQAMSSSSRRTADQVRRNLTMIVTWLAGSFLATLAAGAVFAWVADSLLDLAPRRLAFLIPLSGALVLMHALLLSVVNAAGTAVLGFALARVARETASPVAPPAPKGERLPSRYIAGLGRYRGRLLIGGGALALAAGASTTGIAMIESLTPPAQVAITAHRGDSSREPENTVAAIESAARVGADFAEIDVQTTKDGHVVVFHDENLQRIAGSTRLVDQMTLAELQAIDLGQGLGPGAKGMYMPTLDQVIDACGDRLKLNIELKYARHQRDVRPLVEKVLAILARRGFEDRCVLSSLTYPSLEVARRQTKIPVGFIVTQGLGDITRLEVDFLSVQARLATEVLIARARAQQLPVHVWTVNSLDEFDTLVDRGVANILTDDPASLVARRAELEELTDIERLALRYRSLIQR